MDAAVAPGVFSEEAILNHLKAIHKNNLGTFGEIFSDYTKLSRDSVKARRTDKPKSETQVEEQKVSSAIQKTYQEHLNQVILERDEKTKLSIKLAEEKQQLVAAVLKIDQPTRGF